MNTQSNDNNSKVNTDYLWDSSFESDFLLQQANAKAWNNYTSGNSTNINQPYPISLESTSTATATTFPTVNSPQLQQQQNIPFSLNNNNSINDIDINNNPNNNNNNNSSNLFNTIDQDTSLAYLSQSLLNIKNEAMVDNPINIVGPACLFNGDTIDLINSSDISNNNQNLTPYNQLYNNNIQLTKSAPNTPPKGPYIFSNDQDEDEDNDEEGKLKVNESSNLKQMFLNQQQHHKSVPNSPTHLQVSWTEDQLSVPSTTSPLSSPSITPAFQFDKDKDNINNISFENQQVSSLFSNPLMNYERNRYSSYQHQHQYQYQPYNNQHPRKSAHNAVEKKYRNNINDKIGELRDAVPALRHARIKKDNLYQRGNHHQQHTDDEEDISPTSSNHNNDEPIFMDGVAVATKLNKATILQKATEYIYHLQHTNQDLHQDIESLLNIIMTYLPSGDGKNIVDQYRQHYQQRDQFQKNQLALKEKEKRNKKSSPYHNNNNSGYQHYTSATPPPPPSSSSTTSTSSNWDVNMQKQQNQQSLLPKLQYQQQDQSFLPPYNPSTSAPSSSLVSNSIEDNSQGRQQKYSIEIPY
ncbi:helix-loop-helix DNA-binding domain-containing protein [Cunninghamella echinulata]|nr:helix-loop-helix DNA-binding domain-containing protein [Cunninghamella echinulata]